MELIEIIGFAAGLSIAISLLPQFIKSWKTKSTKDIAILWLIVNILGQALWLTYGVFKESISLIIMSLITLLISGSILTLKIKYG